MTALDPELTVLFAVSSAAMLIMLSGVRKGVLEWRRPPRRCPACGRRRHGSRCGCVSN